MHALCKNKKVQEELLKDLTDTGKANKVGAQAFLFSELSGKSISFAGLK